MKSEIRKMLESDRETILKMMRVFYNSAAVLSNGSDEIYEKDFTACVGENPYIEGYVFHDGGEIQGYAMAAKSFSTEFGKPCIWIEDLYIAENYRGCGIGSVFLDFIAAEYPDALLRLEAERENTAAVRMYEKHGFEELPYLELIRHKAEG